MFEFLSISRNDFLFTVTKRFTVQSTPEKRYCSEDCCDTVALSTNNQFQIPGVRITNRELRPLVFSPSAVDFQVEQFQTTANEISYDLSAGGQVYNNSILLLRFFTRKYCAGQSGSPGLMYSTSFSRLNFDIAWLQNMSPRI